MPSELEQLRATVAATSSFVGGADGNGRPCWVNEAGRRLSGLAPEDPLPEHISAFHPGWAARLVLEQGIPTAVREGTWRGETALLDADGDEVPVSETLVAHLDAAGKLDYLNVVMKDLRQTKRLQSHLQYQSRLLDAVGEAVIATDLEGHIEYWNPAAERMYGWEAGEVLGRSILEVTPTRSEAARSATVFARLRRGETWSGELLVQHRDGRRFPALVTDSPYLDERGRIAGVIGVSTDVTELRTAREQAQQRAAQQGVVALLGQEVLAASDLDAVLTQACATVAEVLDVEMAKVLELDADEQRLWLRAGVGWSPGLVGQAVVDNSDASQAGYTLLHEKPVVVTDFAIEDRFTPPPLLTDHGVASGMSVTIPCRPGYPYGVLSVHSRSRREYPEDDAQFLRSVAHLVGAAVDRHESARELQALALYDPLTGLANRSLIDDRLAGAVGRTHEDSNCAAVLLVDLDGFKLVNDGLGHAAGDELLVEIARRLNDTVERSDTVGRLGSDEFAVVCERLPGSDSRAAQRVAELTDRVRKAVSGHYELSGGEVYVTASIGVALNVDAADPRDLKRNAHAALVRAKGRGGDAVELYDQRLREQAGERLELVNALRHAHTNGEFFLVYHPEIDLRTGELFALEALLRWRHPEHGVVGPSGFMDVVEETGLVVPLGTWVLQQACHQVMALPRGVDGLPPAASVNVSPRQLVDRGLVTAVDDALDRSGLPPDRLFLEITETAMLHDPDHALATLNEVRGRGVNIAVDDFGTGYSSLTHLRRFPVDLLKIDRSFVANLLTAGSSRTIVEALIGLASTLDLTCVAEGIETEQQVSDLRALGCDVGQGYLWSKPLDVEAIAAWLTERSGSTS